jgi:hypothetical protein
MGTYRRLVVRLALFVIGLAAWVGIVAFSVLLSQRRQRNGRRGWPCIAGGAVVGLIVFYFVAGFAAM